ncbi:MAG: histidine kinase [Sporomusaceae bacterium]|jgi:two-component system LytT family sensor kinase/two-component system sensor histidine kinase LytS|nr:histidine kinase [Sporomusaceae bacterium]
MVLLLLELIGAFSFIAMTAYLTGRSRFIMRCVFYPFRPANQFFLIILFSFFAITGNYSAIPWGETSVTTRLVGVLVAGIIGGPGVGFCVGLSCGFELTRTILNAQTIIIVLIGTLTGFLRKGKNFRQISPATGASIAIVAELCQISWLMLFLKPEPLSFYLLHTAFPTMLTSIIGVWLFLFIVNIIETEQDIYSARAAQLSLKIASLTLPYLRLGFNSHSAEVTARIIYELTKVDAVLITGKYKYLAVVGQGVEQHIPGQPIVATAVKEVVANKAMKIINTALERGAPPFCRLIQSSVVVPLFIGSYVIGTIELARTNNETVSELDIRIADGIARLLSVQIQIAEIDKQRKMREKAELKALRAQINPHFLFNTINIIMSFCRTDPDKARLLLGSLSTLLERAYSNQSEFLPLKDELTGVSAYLEIAKSRFGDRLDIAVHVDDAAEEMMIPALSLQPLVENALNHGLFPKSGYCLLAIEAIVEKENLVITITDNGIGIEAAKLAHVTAGKAEGVGVSNVNQRLASIYGPEYELTIASEPHFGTEVQLRIPAQYEPVAPRGDENQSGYY